MNDKHAIPVSDRPRMGMGQIIFQRRIFFIPLVLLLSLVGWLLLRQPMNHHRSSASSHAAVSPQEMANPSPHDSTVSQVAKWDGQPAPTPNYYVRPTAKYLDWFTHFTEHLAQLDAHGMDTQAAAERQWFHQFDTKAQQEALGRGSVVAASYQITRTRVHPPLPAYERFYGYKVVLPWNGATYYYAANSIPPGTPYLLHPDGIRDGGTPLRALPDVHAILTEAGVTDLAARDVLIKVSQYEGGFDAVNTWDTGYVSVGFIQFITGKDGEGNSLVHVLERMKHDESLRAAQTRGYQDEFTCYFSSHGIDVSHGHLYVRDPGTGRVMTGADAVALLIHDKRLTALFQDAGRKSRAFQIAQVREAYGAYYLGTSPFRIPVAEISIYTQQTPPSPQAAMSETTPAPTADGTSATATVTPVKPATAPSSPPPSPTFTLSRTEYVYGEAAIQEAQIDTSTPEQFARLAQQPSTQKTVRVFRRLSDLTGIYGQALPSEGGQVTLMDRAVQWGVRQAKDTFVASVNALHPDHELSLTDLQQHEADLISHLRNRIDVLPRKE